MKVVLFLLVTFALLTPVRGLAQTAAAAGAYQPKFAGDKAHSNAEAAALGYMRTVLWAQKDYKKKHGEYAKTLGALAGHGSFTRRMVDPHRGDYTATFKATADGYWLALTPKQFDTDHRAFYMDETGIIRGSESSPARATSPALD